MENELSFEGKKVKNDYQKSYRLQMTVEAKKLANEYQKAWRKRNPEKMKKYNINYWEKKANSYPVKNIENEVKSLHEAGCSLREIGKALNISHMKVKRILAEL